MKDKELKLEDVKVPHTLDKPSTKILYGLSIIQLLLYIIDSTEQVSSLFEVDLQKTIGESGHGEGVGVYVTLLQSDTL
jgi:hypothetical protein